MDSDVAKGDAPTDGKRRPGRRRRPRGTLASQTPGGAWRTTITLHKLARETILSEMLRRGTEISDTIGSLINEWRIYQGQARASEFRHSTRGDLQALLLNARLVASKTGAEREAALKEMKDAGDRLNGRLVLVTML